MHVLQLIYAWSVTIGRKHYVDKLRLCQVVRGRQRQLAG